MNEIFAKPSVGAIIEKEENGIKYVLIQTRQKEGAGIENGMIEFPAGKIREYENIFDTLKREVLEETGLHITKITGESDVIKDDVNGYEVISFLPFCITQNLSGGYSIILQTFICKAEGSLLQKSDEAENIRWITIEELKNMYVNNKNSFFPLHINSIKKYLCI